jgi:predicted nucleic acid-binding protein
LIVVDASAIVAMLLKLPGAGLIQDRIAGTDEMIVAPHLIDAEVVHAIRRYVAMGHASAHRGFLAIEDFSDMGIQRYPHGGLLERVWELRDSLTAYDAIYVALAELLEAPLLTRDRRLAAAHGHGARIEAV